MPINTPKLKLVIAIFLIAVVSSCTTSHRPTAAPVVDLRSEQELKRGYHIVTPGETLYFVAWRFGLDYRQLAESNHLTPPYRLTVGQKLVLNGQAKYYEYAEPTPKTKAKAESTKPTKRPTAKSKTKSKPAAPPLPPANLKPVRDWQWPAQGKVIESFSLQNKGINIAGTFNEPVRAAAAGEIVYAGNLRGYGNMLLIKHNDIYLSAYAHNQVLLVQEGQIVKAGQIIAKMGSSGTDRVMLHFELRKSGKAVNPLKYLS